MFPWETKFEENPWNFSWEKKREFKKGKPIWPMNAVSTREASGSAAKAIAAGIAMRATSKPSSSGFKTFLHLIQIVQKALIIIMLAYN